MNFGYDSLIGISAAFLTTLSFVPQIIKAHHTKRMKDVSRYLMVLFTTGFQLLTYEANQPFKHIVVDSKLDIHLNFM
ncbi:MAG: SemiSWEET family sugar transporter [Nitrososphaeraceae archaeon]